MTTSDEAILALARNYTMDPQCGLVFTRDGFINYSHALLSQSNQRQCPYIRGEEGATQWCALAESAHPPSSGEWSSDLRLRVADHIAASNKAPLPLAMEIEQLVTRASPQEFAASAAQHEGQQGAVSPALAVMELLHGFSDEFDARNVEATGDWRSAAEDMQHAISQLLDDVRAALAAHQPSSGQQEPDRGPIPYSDWRHGNGYLCAGTLRLFRADFDTNPSKKWQDELMDWMVRTLNRAQAAYQPSSGPPCSFERPDGTCALSHCDCDAAGSTRSAAPAKAEAEGVTSSPSSALPSHAESALLPCPFCGGEAVANYSGDLARAYCRKCFANIYNYQWSIEHATAAWNRRAAGSTGAATEQQQSMGANSNDGIHSDGSAQSSAVEPLPNAPAETGIAPPKTSEPDALVKLCVCAETSSRNCPLHSEPAPTEQAKLQALLAEAERLCMEHCPEEMSAALKADWERHQVAAPHQPMAAQTVKSFDSQPSSQGTRSTGSAGIAEDRSNREAVTPSTTDDQPRPVAEIEQAGERFGPYLTHSSCLLRVYNSYVPKVGDKLYTSPPPAPESEVVRQVVKEMREQAKRELTISCEQTWLWLSRLEASLAPKSDAPDDGDADCCFEDG